MRSPIAILLLLAGASAANAQYADPSYGGGYAQPYQPQAPYQGGQPGMPSYQDDGAYDAGESYGSDDARADAVPDYRVAPPPGGARRNDAVAERYAQQQRDYRAQLDAYNRRVGGGRGGDRYAARAAELRAQADACERGDERACDER